MKTNFSILLHICCGICAIESINRLKQQNYNIIGFYYNPNIHPEEEFFKRKRVVEEVSKIFNIKIIYGDYEPQVWISLCKGYETELEGGKRCEICYKIRLEKTYNLAKEQNFDFFTTTLTISPHKNSQKIFELGEQIGKEKFLKIDFKKQDGFKKTIDIAKQYGFYRQNYCGCIYSKKK